MRHRPALPDDSVNVSQTHPLREALWMTGALVAILLVIFFTTSFAVDLVVSQLPRDSGRSLRPQLENALFAQYGEPLDDARAQRAQEVFERLLEATGREDEDIRLIIIDSPLVNALAVPGGLIAVFAGLLDEVESDNELTMILGHEIGHLENRDGLRQLGRRIVVDGLTAILFGSTGSLDALLLQTPSMALQFRYSRRREHAADEIGFELLCEVYGHSGGAEAFFARHAKSPMALPFFTTHPVSAERVERIVAARADTACAEGETVLFIVEKSPDK